MLVQLPLRARRLLIMDNNQIYKGRLGIMVLDRKYLLVKGNAGRTDSYPFPTVSKVITGLYNPPTPPVYDGSGNLKHDAKKFMRCAFELQEMGVIAIISSCGFFCAMQEPASKILKVPIYTSPLFLIPFVLSVIPSTCKCGVVTLFRDVLYNGYLSYIVGNNTERIVLADMSQAFEFRRMIENDRADVNESLLRKEVFNASVQLARSDPSISALIMECSDMTPYSAAVRNAINIPVYDYTTLARMAYYSNGGY